MLKSLKNDYTRYYFQNKQIWTLLLFSTVMLMLHCSFKLNLSMNLEKSQETYTSSLLVVYDQAAPKVYHLSAVPQYEIN